MTGSIIKRGEKNYLLRLSLGKDAVTGRGPPSESVIRRFDPYPARTFGSLIGSGFHRVKITDRRPEILKADHLVITDRTKRTRTTPGQEVRTPGQGTWIPWRWGL